MGRAPCCDKTKVKRGPWSPEEDSALKSYLQKFGTGGNWIALPQKAGLKRCGKSCRLRWLNYLRPDIKHGGFTEEEDNVILTLYANIGSRWSVIASQLPGRTDNDVKNYWNTKLKKKLMSAGAVVQPKLAAPTTTAMVPVNFNHSSTEEAITAMKVSSTTPLSPFNQVQANYYGNSAAASATTTMDMNMMLIQGGYRPELTLDWLFDSLPDQLSLPGLTEVQENGGPYDGLFTSTSSSQEISGPSSSSSLARSYASWSTDQEMGMFVELESKSSNGEHHHLHHHRDRRQEEDDGSFELVGYGGPVMPDFYDK